MKKRRGVSFNRLNAAQIAYELYTRQLLTKVEAAIYDLGVEHGILNHKRVVRNALGLKDG